MDGSNFLMLHKSLAGVAAPAVPDSAGLESASPGRPLHARIPDTRLHGKSPGEPLHARVEGE